MRLRRPLALSMGICALAAGTSGPGASTADVGGGAATPAVLISPGLVHATSAVRAPPTTAYCEQHYKIACYQPAQLQRAYNLPALLKPGD